MDPAGSQPVSRTDSESLIAALEHGAVAGDPLGRAGVFGPDSASWKINRESALFLGAGRAALLQLAHPWVATALDQHSNVMERPVARFHSTFRIVFTMIFGSVAQATAAARHLYEVHTYIQGEMAADVSRWRRGSHYQANEVAALRWVFATLIESAVLAYETVLPPLTPAELGAYYADSVRLAGLFGIPPGALPGDWESFLIYCRGMEESDELGVTDSARRMAHDLLRGANAWIKPPRWYRALTTGWLPGRFRSEFQLPFGAEEERAVAAARARLPRYYRRLPRRVRFVGPWQEAQARIGDRGTGFVARLSNRFWIGEPAMPFAS
ncbi:oxygenase MpaB family protein [Occallatibacter riparius]|uniref:DUF2236 domain-containing protein n=1 Tax=Occallatibacter riparius TaxID=1002689 RepID=A0A9J7BYI7_9BACT|nr:oxygenase MpaB family protein [Occallatibacter riparius]UWZ86334.1 DUF2236 domain-containing protein [Occallatibacter riparius]